MQKIWELLKSRKFWALVAAIVGVAAALATGEITELQALQLAVQALMAYIVGTGIEAGLAKRG